MMRLMTDLERCRVSVWKSHWVSRIWGHASNSDSCNTGSGSEQWLWSLKSFVGVHLYRHTPGPLDCWLRQLSLQLDGIPLYGDCLAEMSAMVP